MTAQVEDGLLLAMYNFYLAIPMDRFTDNSKQIAYDAPPSSPSFTLPHLPLSPPLNHFYSASDAEKAVHFRQFKFENPTNTEANVNMTYPSLSVPLLLFFLSLYYFFFDTMYLFQIVTAESHQNQFHLFTFARGLPAFEQSYVHHPGICRPLSRKA